MGLTGEGYRTGGECLIQSRIILNQYAPLLSMDVVAEAQKVIEGEGPPIFYVEWDPASTRKKKNGGYTKGAYVLAAKNQSALLFAAERLGYTMVKCMVGGTPDPLLKQLTIEEERHGG